MAQFVKILNVQDHYPVLDLPARVEPLSTAQLIKAFLLVLLPPYPQLWLSSIARIDPSEPFQVVHPKVGRANPQAGVEVFPSVVSPSRR